MVHDAAEVVVGPAEGAGAEAGAPPPQADELLERHEDAAVAVVDGRVAAAGPTEAVTREYPPENAAEAVDAAGGAVIPGFVDAHTHALFAGDRSDEFEAKLRGKTYEDILAEGGGILRTVGAVRAADDGTLLSNLLTHLDRMLAAGTTTVEVKSGYGLDVETELRMLDVIDRADRRHPVDVVPTFMGAHAVPEGLDSGEYVDRVVEDQIPAVADQGIARFCDVFCEEGVFSVEESRRVLAAGAEAGMAPKVHAEELTHLGGTQLAAEVGATSADHLLHATDEDVSALREAGVTPVLLPGTAFGLGAEYADARRFLDGASWDGAAPVAVATDFNPNCYSRAMGFAASLSCVEMGMTPAESVLATTRGGAAALDLDDGRGTLGEGAPADLAVLSAPSHRYVPYNFGETTVRTVLKEGERVHG
ncbi:imidazolonepropionase [Halobacteriales archaeon QS_8_69_26]|nr:MAG: imidazolonepropionase [Halobacteriales archaeon QS_8_69_26]